MTSPRPACITALTSAAAAAGLSAAQAHALAMGIPPTKPLAVPSLVCGLIPILPDLAAHILAWGTLCVLIGELGFL